MTARMSKQAQAEARRQLLEEELDTQAWVFDQVARLEELKLGPAEHRREIDELGRLVPPWDPAWEFLRDRPRMTTRVPKKARDEARRRWQLQEEEREGREAEIARLGKSGQLGTMTNEEIEDHLGVWIAPPPPPAMRFIMDRLKGRPPGSTGFDDKDKQMIVDLVASDVPLDRRTRSLVAGELRRLYFPNKGREGLAKQRLEAAMIEDMTHLLQSRGMTKTEAQREIVKSIGRSIGVKNVEALQKRLQRARK
jgi:hypothetical protein